METKLEAMERLIKAAAELLTKSGLPNVTTERVWDSWHYISRECGYDEDKTMVQWLAMVARLMR